MTSQVMVSATCEPQNLGMNKWISGFVLVAFAALSVELVSRVGLSGLQVLRDGWGLQVALDLVIACCFVGSWIIRDARRHGLSPWPFVAALPFVGTLAALAYLVRRDWSIGGSRPPAEPLGISGS